MVPLDNYASKGKKPTKKPQWSAFVILTQTVVHGISITSIAPQRNLP